ncbi:unnamed protein product [Didymodactylos carnosus]|uniref:Fatty acid synthase n=1 Tax=Didymodactylos carnosus TaxID=1234261 RepID=A0A814C7S2_9BILA|nr:unnamed protein product [Didymodactylos carnosus]CAF3713462.1 unnamed protein product [Didymodactylos carnosus]
MSSALFAINSCTDEEDFIKQLCIVVQNQPDGTCLITENEEYISFKDVYMLMKVLHESFQILNVQSKQLIAIYMNRNYDMIISILASIANRSPFLLIEHSTPQLRLKTILDDAKPSLIITDKTLAENLTDIISAESVKIYNELVKLKAGNNELHPSILSAEDIMYIMYTSGTTGQPKGVMVPYRAIINRFQWMWKNYQWQKNDRQIWKTSVVFGDCIWEMLGGLLKGIPTVIASKETASDPTLLIDIIYKTSTTRITLIPTMLSSILKVYAIEKIQQYLKSLHTVIVSGEIIPKALCKLFLLSFSNVKLLNLYGSTEIGNDAFCYEINNHSDYENFATVPIGKPITNMDYIIVNDNNIKIEEPSATGELLISGPGLFTAYLNFTSDKLIAIDNRIYFKTGDLVSISPKTEDVMFLGRLDAQVKVRGVRIELEEIEAIFMQYPSVQDAACFVNEKSQIVALYKTLDQHHIEEENIRKWIKLNLPDNELPSLYCSVDYIPKTISGKVDRKKLFCLYEKNKNRIYVQDKSNEHDKDNNVSCMLLKTWCDTLGINNTFCKSSTFIELGGHSLLAVEIQRRIQRLFNLRIPIQYFFQQTKLSDIIKFVDDNINQHHQKRKLSSIDDYNSIQTAPLSYIQQGMWVDDEINSLGTDYNVECTYEIKNKHVTNIHLRKSVQTLVERHCILRTIFERNSYGNVVQIVKPLEVNLDGDLFINNTKIYEHISVENQSPEDAIQNILIQLTTKKYFLNSSKPCYTIYLLTTDSISILTMVFHHIIIDGWSIGIILHELEKTLSYLISDDYNKKELVLKPIELQYHHYAYLEQENMLESMSDDLTYWIKQLNNGDIIYAHLSPDYLNHDINNNNESSTGATIQLEFPLELIEKIQSVCKTCDITPFILLLTTFKSLLARYTDEMDICLGTPVSARNITEIENTVGLFTNTIIIYTRIDNDLSFFELLNNVKQTVLDSFEHQNIPFSYMTQHLKHLKRNTNNEKHSMLQIMFAYQNAGEIFESDIFDKLSVINYTSKFDLEIQIWKNINNNCLVAQAQYSTRLFKPETIQCLLKGWIQLTQSALNSPNNKMSKQALLDISEKQQLVGLFNETFVEQPLEKNLCQLFNEQIQRTPHVTAVEYNKTKLTYGELWQRSQLIASRIHQYTSSQDQQCIAIGMDRNIELIQIIWGILLSSNYYVYIDPTLPIQRKNFILKDTNAKLIITDNINNNELNALTITYDELISDSNTSSTEIDRTKSSSFAYILYTSGSTGQPKGVCTTHRNIISRTVNVPNLHNIKKNYRVGQVCSFGFDVSSFELFATLLNGGTLVIIKQESICSATELIHLKLNMICPSTAVFNILAKQTDTSLFSKLDSVLFGGEKVNIKYVKQVLKQPPRKLINVYGPTETTIFALCFTIDQDKWMDYTNVHTIPIGRPLPNTKLYVVDKNLELLPKGMTGELLIAGAGLSFGYLNNFKLTSEKFIINPFINDNTLVYRSGDMVKMHDDGNIEFLHRLDNQVKVRSQRLEMGEIQTQLLLHESVNDAIVLLRTDIIEEEQHIVAYIETTSSSFSIEQIEKNVHEFLVERLPKYMIPSFIIIMDKLPLNHVGKIDRKMLPKPEIRQQKNLQDAILEIFSNSLKIQGKIALENNFFHLGGHSLMAMEIIAKIYEKFRVNMTIPSLFQSKTVAEFIEKINNTIIRERKSQPATLNSSSSSYQAKLTEIQKAFWLIWKIKPDSCYYNVPIAIEINGHLDQNKLYKVLHALMKRYEILRIVCNEEKDGSIWQVVKNKNWLIPFTEVDIDMNHNNIVERLQAYSVKPFDLKNGPVCRFTLFHNMSEMINENERHLLLITFHHIVCDGFTLNKFIKELIELYSSTTIYDRTHLQLSTKLSFMDYVNNIQPVDTRKHLEILVNNLKTFQYLNLEIEQTENQQQHDISHNQMYSSRLEIENKMADRLRKLAMENQCTLFTLLLALFKCVLSVYSHNCLDIIIGTVISTRSQHIAQSLFGPMINTLPIRSRIPNKTETTFIDILNVVKQSVLLTMENQQCSFADIVNRLRPINNDKSLQTYMPVYRVLFEMNSYNDNLTFNGGISWKYYDNNHVLLPYAKTDIDLHVNDEGANHSIIMYFDVNSTIFLPQTVQKMATCFQTAVEFVVEGPACLKATLWEKIQLSRCGNYSNLTIHEQLHKRVNKIPKQNALVYGDINWTYEQLLGFSKHIASVLKHSYNISPQSVVAVCMKRSPDLISSMFGVVMTGSAYLYIDILLPEKTILSMLHDSACSLIICDMDCQTVIESIANNTSLICVSIKTIYEQHSLPFSTNSVIVKPSDTCYIIYTSGSTGTPKGIQIQHQAVVQRTQANFLLKINSDSKIAQITSCSFDVYILEVYGALLNDACLFIYDHNYLFQTKLLAEILKADQITHMFIATPIFNILAEHVPYAFSNMECVMFAGDRANAKLMLNVLRNSHPAPKQLVNAYGPTEATCIVTWYHATEESLSTIIDKGDQVPIGKSLPNTPLYIVDPISLELVEDGTNGRLDNQVKIDGYRIELSQIENLLKNHSKILDSIIIVRDDIVKNKKSIIAYIKKQEPLSVTSDEILFYLSQHLPKYMIPTFIVFIEQLPLSIGGKVDYVSLPKPQIGHVIKNDNNEKQSAYTKIQEAWREVLSQNANIIFTNSDDFFACGGTSITVVQLHAILEKLFDVTLDVMKLFHYTTIENQLKWILSIGNNNYVRKNNITEESSGMETTETETFQSNIAVIGMSARYGNLDSLDDFWNALCNGTDCCLHTSYDELSKNVDMKQMLKLNPRYVHSSCVMEKANYFDHVFFQMTKRDAEIMDPQHRVLLETTYEALENAGIVPQAYCGTIGIFAALYRNTYADYYNLFRASPFDIYDDTKIKLGITMLDPALAVRAEISNMTDGAPTFIAFKLGLTGPAMAIQTACSSSGTALHIAMRSIEVGDCDVAIVGGVCIQYPLGSGYNYQPGMTMSKTGYCRAFDSEADGVVGGDGAGIVILMKASEAIQGGYNIRAIVKGHAINNDGRKKNSYSTTSSDMQAQCMKKALAMARIDNPQNEIGLIEAHGPGTQLGDLLEVTALTKSYKSYLNNNKIYLGSIKTIVGHSAHAASIAGFIKIVLALETSKIPPTLNFKNFSSLIAQIDPPFVVNTKCVSWPKTKQPKRAALNALGQGGTNSHFILQEYVYQNEQSQKQLPNSKIFIFSARDNESLVDVKQRFIDYLPNLNNDQLWNTAYTLACGRTEYNARDFTIASSVNELQQQLNTQKINHNVFDEQKIVFLFPGQGCQYAGMAKYIYDNFVEYKQIIDKCLNLIEDLNIRKLIKICLLEETYQNINTLNQYAQITLFITEYSLTKLFLKLNLKPDYLIGHSSGELVAACLSQVFSLENAIKFLTLRCQLMTVNPDQGGMIAVQVKSNDDAKQLAIEFDVDIAAINTRTQYVFSGRLKNIKMMETKLKSNQRKIKLLNTFSAFHSRLMTPVCQQLESFIKNIPLQHQQSTASILSTVTGKQLQNNEVIQPHYWINHLQQPVLFGPCIENLLNNLENDNKSLLFVQVGPGKILTSVVQNILPNANIISSPLISNNSSTSFLQCLGSAWSYGVPISFHAYYSSLNYSLKRIPLPTYPFRKILCVASDRANYCTDNKNNNALPGKCNEQFHNTTNETFKDGYDSIKACPIFKERETDKSTENSLSKKVSWKIKRTDADSSLGTNYQSCMVKLLDFQSEKSHQLNVPSQYPADKTFELGFASSIFTKALYFEAIENGLLTETTKLISLLPDPNEYTVLQELIVNDLLNGLPFYGKNNCETVEDLLMTLTCLKLPIENDGITNIFSISLLGHILSALYNLSYNDLFCEKFIKPFGLLNTSNCGCEAYYPAIGIKTTVQDLEKLLMTTYCKSKSAINNSTTSIIRALRNSFINTNYLSGKEYLIPLVNISLNKALIIACEQHTIPATALTMISKEAFDSDINNKKPDCLKIDYTEIVQQCLFKLLGSAASTMMKKFSLQTSFSDLGVDSLQAITFVDMLSQDIGNELSVDLVFEYSTIESLANRLQKLFDRSELISPNTDQYLTISIRNYIMNTKWGMPKVYESTKTNQTLEILLKFISKSKTQLRNELHECGALLFRGFNINTAENFSRTVALLVDTNKTFLDYRDGISPRTRITDKVFTSTDYPKQFDMALHNEMSYANNMPSIIFFFCQIPPSEDNGGETPIGNSKIIYEKINSDIRNEFIEKKLMYVTNMPSRNKGLGKSWQETYQTESKLDVEKFLNQNHIQFQWLSDDRLRTIRRADAVKKHPVTNDWLWCNHAHLFHPIDLHDLSRQMLQKRLNPMDMPKNCFFGNGESIPDQYLIHIREVLKNEEIKWLWQKNDVLVLDNYKTAHGRASFDGERRVLVAMC